MGERTGAPKAAFAKILRQRRKAAGLSQERLALDAGLDRTYISMLERRVRQPALGALIAIARSLGVKAWQIVAAVEQELEGAATSARQRPTPGRRSSRRKARRVSAYLFASFNYALQQGLDFWADCCWIAAAL
jgi:transcriptional regulator with XRE-family HTH domain